MRGAGGALLPTQAKQLWPLMDDADGMDERSGCRQRAAGRGGGERVGSDVGSWRGRGGGVVLASQRVEAMMSLLGSVRVGAAGACWMQLMAGSGWTVACMMNG
ncbi:hypothetical protein ACLOJK_008462 [Asimina triloba]